MTVMEAYYRSLGLRPGASQAQIKSAYRQLARQYHPDRQVGEPAPQSEARFIEITQAYRQLMESQLSGSSRASQQSPVDPPHSSAAIGDPNSLKYKSYQRLRHLFRQGRFAQAMALIDGLAQRFPADREVRQWQAIACQQLGLQLIKSQQYLQAIRYLQKAIATDPSNQSLKASSHQALRKIQRLRQTH